MSRENKSRFFFMKPSFWGTLIIGATLGIASQRIPESKVHTDKLIHQIELSHFFHRIESSDFYQAMRSKISTQSHQFDIADAQFDYVPYQKRSLFPGNPISSFIVHRTGYSLAYDARTHNPSWVYEHLTADNIKGDADRSQFKFKEDETIPQHLRATPADYKGNGLDQGHMAPAADHRASPDAMKDTFYLTNICPQCPQLNRNYWAKLEKHVRDLTQRNRHVYVITGPLYLPYQEGKRRFVKYQVIGSNDVAVPSHFFKVILLENEKGEQEVRAYILPNSVIPSDTPMESFRTTVQKVEKAAGMLLFNPQT